MSNLKSIKNDTYKPSEIEPKWQKVWEEKGIYKADLDASTSLSTKKPFYNLMMFPYPSAEGMHVGNMYAFTGADIYGRFMRMKGSSVFEPIGLDGFGIHSENYAIKVGRHPKEQAEISEKNFYRQLRTTGNSYNWDRTVETYDPKYYKWTQWLFVQLFKADLAYRKKAPVNFCPSCKTVLADEQVMDGQCERCNFVVEKRDLEQWFFKITKYADRLLNGLSQINWVEKVKTAQKEWIGRSEGALIEFKIQPFGFAQGESSEFKVKVFTTRQDTLFGAAFLVLSPEHPFVASFLKGEFEVVSDVSEAARSHLARLGEVKSYVEEAKGKSEQERITEGKEKSGVFTGLYAINPVNNEKIPVWIADYVLMGYGTGVIMAVPAHDQRDFDFAKKYNLQIIKVIKGEKEDVEVYEGEGKLINSGSFTGLDSREAKKKIVVWLEEKNLGKTEVQYHFRDWLISRQRYWGPPIPMIYCKTCDWQPVPEDQLPVELPFIKDYKPMGMGQAPLASHPEFYKTKCPKCGMDAKRETDVSDTFLDSAWYFLRYLATEWDDLPFPSVELAKNQKTKNKNQKEIENLKLKIGNSARRAAWLPVDMYIGGAEHSVLHLLYSRFITMVLHDLGFVDFDEPFTRFYAHGLLIKEGAKMSKSKGNAVVPDQYVKKFGADTLRTYLMFMGPFSQGGDFRDTGIEGMYRFIKRVWNLVSSIKYQVLSIDKKGENSNLDHLMHRTIKAVTKDVEKLNYNTAIAHLMEYYNELFSFYTKYEILNTKYCKTFVLLFAPFAPHVSEELWQRLQGARGPAPTFPPASVPSTSSVRAVGSPSSRATPRFSSIHLQPWPKYDPIFLDEEEVTIAVAVNGKTRDLMRIQNSILRQSSGQALRFPFGFPQGRRSGREFKIQNYIEQMAKESANVKKHLAGKKIKKVIYVAGKIINFVTNS